MSYQETYPIVKVPNELIKIDIEPVEPSIPEKPQKPTKPETKGSAFDPLVYIGAFLLMPIISVGTQSMIGFFFSLGLFLFIVFRFSSYREDQAIKAQENYNMRLKNYQVEMNAFPYVISEYDSRITEYELEKKLISNDGNYRQKLILDKQLQFLEKATTPTQSIENVTNGVSEEVFLKELRSYFGEKIYTNLILPNENGRSFHPDFIYWDKEKNFLIDIEIDEPYIGKNGEPIHYSDTDDFRDSIFLSKKWAIVRFTEKQVVKYPQKCCDVINEVIQNTLGVDKMIVSEFEYLPKEAKWSKSDSHKMAFQRYRSTYLPKDLQTKINEETLDSEYDLDDDLPF